MDAARTACTGVHWYAAPRVYILGYALASEPVDPGLAGTVTPMPSYAILHGTAPDRVVSPAAPVTARSYAGSP